MFTSEDEKGKKHEKAFDGLTSRIFQHEYDHMNGSDFTKRVSPLVLQRAKKRLVSNIKKNLRRYGNM